MARHLYRQSPCGNSVNALEGRVAATQPPSAPIASENKRKFASLRRRFQSGAARTDLSVGRRADGLIAILRIRGKPAEADHMTFARPAFTRHARAITEPHLALRRDVRDPPDNGRITGDLAQKRSLNDRRSFAKLVALHSKREMAIDELRRALSRIKKLQAIGERAAFAQHTRR